MLAVVHHYKLICFSSSPERSWPLRCWLWSHEHQMMRPWSQKPPLAQLTALKTSTWTLTLFLTSLVRHYTEDCKVPHHLLFFVYNWDKGEKNDIFAFHFIDRGPLLTSPWPLRSDGKSPRRRVLHRQPESLDSVDSCSSVSSYSSSSHFHSLPSSSSSSSTRRFRFHSKSSGVSSGPAQSQVLNASLASRADNLDHSPTGDQEAMCDEKSRFVSRGTYSAEKGKQKLRVARHPGPRHPREGGGQGRDPSEIPQQLVVYGSNEFMVWRTMGQ